MKRLWTRLWKDQRGAVTAVSALLLYTILILGVIVGLATLRNQIVQEFGDLSVALDHLDQSWEVKYSWEEEPRKYEDLGPDLEDNEGEEPAGISVQQQPMSEGETF